MFKKQRRRISSQRRQIIYKRDGGRCRYCGKKVAYHLYHIDHIVPVLHNGNDYTFNLCMSCPECNMKKGKNKSIVPNKLPFWRNIYGMYLMYNYKDVPEIKDFI